MDASAALVADGVGYLHRRFERDLAAGAGRGDQPGGAGANCEFGALNIIVRTVKPSGDEAQDAGYGLTRNDYVRLLATVPTISKAIPMRIIPSVEFHNKNRKMEGRLVGTTPDYADVTRLTVDRGRFLDRCRRDGRTQLLRAGRRSCGSVVPDRRAGGAGSADQRRLL